MFIAEQGDSACREVRAEIPVQGLQQFPGWDADVCSVVFENADGKLYGYDHLLETTLPVPHVIVLRHTNGPEGEPWDMVAMVEQARAKGQQVWFDCDDDMWNLPAWNPASEWVTDGVRKIVEANMNACDGVLASTDALADVIRLHVDVPVVVIPAGVQPDRYTTRPRPDEGSPLRLAWFGSLKWREPDIELVVPALREALADSYGRVEFWHVGWQYDAPSIRGLLGNDFPVEVVEWPWTPLPYLPWVMSMIDCAIVPQPVHPFSEARSNGFGLRLSAAGIPWAATQTMEYSRLWSYGAGYMVPDVETWPHAISILTAPEYYEARQDMRHTGRRVARAHDERATAQRYVDVFSGVI